MTDASLFEAVFHRSPIGAYLLSPTTEAIVLAVNDAFLQAVSRKREEVIGKSIFASFTDNSYDSGTSDVVALRHSLDRVIATGQTEFLPMQRYPICMTGPTEKNEEECVWNAINTPIFDKQDQLQCILHTTVDITQQVHAEHALRESNRFAVKAARQAKAEREQWITLLEASPIAVFFANAQGSILKANSIAKTSWNNFPHFQSFTNSTDWKGYWADGSERHGQQLAPHEWPMARMLNGNSGVKKYQAMIDIESNGGSKLLRTVLVSANPLSSDNEKIIGGIVTVMDVTEHIKVQTRIQDAGSHLRFILDSAKIGDWDLDLLHDTSQHSPRFNQCFGYKEPLAHWGFGTFVEHVHPDDRAFVREAFEAAVREFEDWHFECRVIWPDQSIHWLSAHVCVYEHGAKAARMAGIVYDITARKSAELQLYDSSERFRKIVSQAATGVVETDASGVMTLVNQKFCDMLKHTESELLGKNVVDITAPDSIKSTLAAVQKLAAGGPDFVIEKQYRRKDGSFMWATSSISALRGSTGDFQGLVAIVIDITDRKQAEETIRHASLHDALTGLPNRTMLFEYAGHLLSNDKRVNQRAAVLFLDLDRFKPINDSHGHEVGDMVLKQVADRLTTNLRVEDIVIRLGGDEFVILLQNIRGTTYAAEVTRHIVDKINQPYHIGDLALSLSASVGISMYPNDGKNIEALISHADMAMYQAKQAGRNNFQFYSAAYSKDVTFQLKIEQQLKTALSTDAFHLFYQPVIDIGSGKIVSVEALLRWRGTDIGPSQFVPIAEMSGVINPIGRWLLREASRQHKTWTSHGLPLVPIAVNISVVEFRDKNFVDRFEKMIRQHDIATNALQLEVTETAVMDDIDHAIEVLSRMKELGIKILLDDFGIGHSNLAYLVRLPLDKVKIDRSFVSLLEHDLAGRAVANAMIALGRTLGLEVVAEGVETKNVMDYIRSHGCTQAQGYYLAKPMAGDTFESWYWSHLNDLKRRSANFYSN